MRKMNIRFRYNRGRELKYLAHLDMMSVFERALRRAGIDVAYSNGFNKRPAMIFGMPISLGMISIAEYADILLNGEIGSDVFMSRLNDKLPKGVEITEAAEIRGTENIMSAIAYARYTIEVEKDKDITSALTDMLNEESILIEKEKKGHTVSKEIRKGLISAVYDDGKIRLFMTSGQNENIKPEEFITALNRYSKKEIEAKEIVREEMYIRDDKGRPALPIDRRTL
jgi:radical SAM-linked protein